MPSLEKEWKKERKQNGERLAPSIFSTVICLRKRLKINQNVEEKNKSVSLGIAIIIECVGNISSNERQERKEKRETFFLPSFLLGLPFSNGLWKCRERRRWNRLSKWQRRPSKERCSWRRRAVRWLVRLRPAVYWRPVHKSPLRSFAISKRKNHEEENKRND